MYTVSDFRFPVYRLLSFCQRKSKSSSSKNTRRETKTIEKSKEKFALVSSLAVTAATALPPSLSQSSSPSPFLHQLLPHLLSSVVILNFDAGTFCALPWLLLKIYTRAYLGTCFAILLPVPSPPSSLFLACSTCLDSSFASQHVASCSCCHCAAAAAASCVVSHLYGHHKL